MQFISDIKLLIKIKLCPIKYGFHAKVDGILCRLRTPAWLSDSINVLLLVIAVGDKLNFILMFTPRK
jgi:hypothetical protein